MPIAAGNRLSPRFFAKPARNNPLVLLYHWPSFAFLAAALLADARTMREKLAAQFPGRDIWDIKFAPGGLVDIEFIAQAAQLAAAQTGKDVLDQNTFAALEKLAAAGVLAEGNAAALMAAARLEHNLTQVLRIAIDGPFKPETATRGLKALLARAGGASDFAVLEARLAETENAVRAIFDRQLPPVA